MNLFIDEKQRNYVRENSDCEYIGSFYKYNKNNKKYKYSRIVCACGKEFEMADSSFKRSPHKKCHNCVKNIVAQAKVLSEDEIRHQVKKSCDSKYVSSFRKNGYIFVNLECAECGDVFTRNASDCTRGNFTGLCNKCVESNRGKGKRLSNEEFTKRVKEIHFGNVIPLSKYKTSKDKVLLKCVECGYIWKSTPGSIMYEKTGCPNCTSSRGEKIVNHVLMKYGYEYEREYVFKELTEKTGNAYRFDFIVYTSDSGIKLIEYDGSHHFLENHFYEPLSDVQRRDEIKNNFCKNKHYPLLRIPYFVEEDRIENIILNFLNHANTEITNKIA